MLTDDERAIVHAADVIRARHAEAEAAQSEPPELLLSPDEERAFRLQGEQAARVSAEYREQAAEERKRQLRDLKALAKMTTPPDPRPPLQVPKGWTMFGGDSSPRFTCWECHQPIWGEVAFAGIFHLCACCNARHQLRCDQCQRSSDDVVPTIHCTDNAWRCDRCRQDIQSVPPERRMRGALAASR